MSIMAEEPESESSKSVPGKKAKKKTTKEKGLYQIMS